MLNTVFYPINFYSLYGPVVTLEDLIKHPLKENETLRVDYWGFIHRIYTPAPNRLNFFERIVFWIRIHVNTKSHLVAINKLLGAFEEQVIQVANQGEDAFESIKQRADALSSLKNDAEFKKGHHINEIESIDLRLKTVQEKAQTILTERKRLTLLLNEQIKEQNLQQQKKIQEQAQIAFHENRNLELLLNEQNLQQQVRAFQDCLTQTIQEFTRLHPEDLRQIMTVTGVPIYEVKGTCIAMLQQIKEKMEKVEKLIQLKANLEERCPYTQLVITINRFWASQSLSFLRELDNIGQELILLIQNLKLRHSLNHSPFTDLKKLLMELNIDEKKDPKQNTVNLAKFELYKNLEKLKQAFEPVQLNQIIANRIKSRITSVSKV